MRRDWFVSQHRIDFRLWFWEIWRSIIGALIELLIIAAILAGMWKAFEKMGRKGWEGIVPFYNLYILLQIVGKPVWWIVLFFIPIVNIVVGVLLCIEVAKGFGKGTGFAIGLALLGFVFWPILGFGERAGRACQAWPPRRSDRFLHIRLTLSTGISPMRFRALSFVRSILDLQSSIPYPHHHVRRGRCRNLGSAASD